MSTPDRPFLRYLGFSSFELVTPATAVLVDPWLTEPEWSSWSPEDFKHVEYVFVTHGAYDHVADAGPVAERTGATVVTEPAVADHLREQGLDPKAIRSVIWGNRWRLTDRLMVRVLETRHLSYFESSGRTRSGIALGFCFTVGDQTIYYVGDTSLFSDLQLFVRQYDPNVIMLPVGGAPGDLAPLPPEDAAIATSWFDDRTVVPVHYVPGNGDLETYREAVAETCKEPPPIRALEVGERLGLSMEAADE